MLPLGGLLADGVELRLQVFQLQLLEELGEKKYGLLNASSADSAE